LGVVPPFLGPDGRRRLPYRVRLVPGKTTAEPVDDRPAGPAVPGRRAPGDGRLDHGRQRLRWRCHLCGADKTGPPLYLRAGTDRLYLLVCPAAVRSRLYPAYVVREPATHAAARARRSTREGPPARNSPPLDRTPPGDALLSAPVRRADGRS